MNLFLSQREITRLAAGIILFIISCILHKLAQGYVSRLLGDDTAGQQGRMTPDPTQHTDIFGSIIFPFAGALSGLPAFGWMKPVPVNPENFKNAFRGQVITALAGPSANLIQAVFGYLLTKVFLLTPSGLFTDSAYEIIFRYTFIYAEINFILFLFNLLPLPPLDGGRILKLMLPSGLQRKFDLVEKYGWVLLFVLLLGGFFKYLYVPVHHFVEIVFGYIHHTSVFTILTLLVAGIAVPYLFMRRGTRSLANDESSNN